MMRLGCAHGFKSTGETITVAVQIDAPPGPEQRFLDMAAGQ